MNFDNLVEDAKKHKALCDISDGFLTLTFSNGELKALILEYIERDRKQRDLVPVYQAWQQLECCWVDISEETYRDVSLTKKRILYTFTAHAQPTPAQIAEPEKPDDVLQAFWDRALSGYRFVMAAKLRKGEPL